MATRDIKQGELILRQASYSLTVTPEQSRCDSGEVVEYELQLQGHPAGADPLHPQQGAVPAVLQAAHQPGIHLHQVH